MTTPTHVAVVIPARDEELLLPRCLRSVEAALASLGDELSQVQPRVFVVLDSCVDQTAAAIAGHDVTVCPTRTGRVGAARALGVDAAAAWAGSDGSLWVANTDADTVVPPDWVRTQLELAGSGVDLVVGTVVPEAAGLPQQAYDEWLARHTLAEGHQHVHGANLGFSLAAYREAGGFLPLSVHEDVRLVEAIRATGRPWVATDATRVVTSPRRVSRVAGGFAAYLDAIDGASA